MISKVDFLKIFNGVRLAYPNFKTLDSPESSELWYELLKDIDYEVLSNAVLQHISLHKYPPSISEIRELCLERMQEPLPNAIDEWGRVQQVISRYGIWNMGAAMKELASNYITAEIVRAIGWRALCTEENPIPLRAYFLKAYEEKSAKAQKDRLIPIGVLRERERLKQLFYTEMFTVLPDEPRAEIYCHARDKMKGVPMPDIVREKLQEMGFLQNRPKERENDT